MSQLNMACILWWEWQSSVKEKGEVDFLELACMWTTSLLAGPGSAHQYLLPGSVKLDSAQSACLGKKYAPSLWLKMKIKCIVIYFLISFLFTAEKQHLLSGVMGCDGAIHKAPLRVRNAELDLCGFLTCWWNRNNMCDINRAFCLSTSRSCWNTFDFIPKKGSLTTYQHHQ